MDIEKLIEQLNDLEACAYGYHINEEVLGMDCSDFEQLMVEAAEEISKISTLQAENEKLKNAADRWEKKWAGLDKAVRNGSVYRPMQEELNLTHEENQSLKDENEQLRAELEQVKRERDTAVEHLRGQCRYCKRNLVCTSRKGPHSNCWEWRGPQKED